MSDAVAIVGLGVTGALGLLSPAIQGRLARRQQQRDHRHQRALADRAELREVVDETIVTVRRLVWATTAVGQEVLGLPRLQLLPWRRAASRRRLEAVAARAQTEAEGVALAGARLEARLTQHHPASRAHRAMVEVYTRLDDPLKLTPLEMAGIGDPRRAGGRMVDAVAALEDPAREARGAYLAAAHALIGAQVAPGENRR